MLLDSNIIIYANKEAYQEIRDFLKNKEIHASTISYIETLGYHKITHNEKYILQQFFMLVILLPILDFIGNLPCMVQCRCIYPDVSRSRERHTSV